MVTKPPDFVGSKCTDSVCSIAQVTLQRVMTIWIADYDTLFFSLYMYLLDQGDPDVHMQQPKAETSPVLVYTCTQP